MASSEDKSCRPLGIQVWNDCSNNCSFCVQKHFIKEVTPLHKKKRSIGLAMSQVLNNDIIKEYQGVMLIGGEIFGGQLKGLYSDWFDLLEAFNTAGLKHVILQTGLMYEDVSDLIESLAIVKDIEQVVISTSYDTLGRFSKKTKDIWDKNLLLLEKLKKKYKFQINVSVIMTQAFIDEYLAGNFVHPKGADRVSLCIPHMFSDHRDALDNPDQYSDKLRDSECEYSDRFLPLRDIDKLAEFAHKFSAQYGYGGLGSFIESAQDIIPSFTQDNDVEPTDFMPRSRCGHLLIAQCYSDSNECLACDLEKLIPNIKELAKNG